MKKHIQKLSDADNTLSTVSEEIFFKIDDTAKLAEIIEEMKKSLEDSEGVGISAIQIKYPKRIFLIKTPQDINHIICINPSFEGIGRKYLQYEGCLSVDNEGGWVRRFSKIKATYTDEKNLLHRIEMKGLQAQVFQHENDHLNGIIFNKTEGYIAFKTANGTTLGINHFTGYTRQIIKYMGQKLLEFSGDILDCFLSLDKKIGRLEGYNLHRHSDGVFNLFKNTGEKRRN